MELSVEEQGPGGAPTILFLHGGGGGGWMWRPQVEAFSPDYHCLVPDLPEQGRSRAVSPFTIQSAAAQMADLIRSRAHGGQAHVVGLSLGAQVLVSLLSQNPDLVRRAIVSSAIVRPLSGMSWISPGIIGASYNLFMAPLKNSDWWINLNRKYAAGVPAEYAAQFKSEFQGETRDGFTHIMLENLAFRLPSGLEKVTAPTLVVVGQKEYGAMRQSARDLAAAIPTARAYTVAHQRRMSLAEEHNWNMTAPSLFNAMLKDWLDGRPLPGDFMPLS